jgi:hypothetical protein
VDCSGSPELRQRYGVITAEDYRDDAGAVDRLEAVRDTLVARFNIAWDDGNIAVVYDRDVVEDRYIQARIVAPEEVGDAAYPLRAEAGSGAEGGACVEWRAYYRGVCVRQVPHIRQAHKGAHIREARGLERVSRLVTGQEAP